MDQKSNAFLETEKIGVLMRKYAIPCIISLLVAALYNIVDQIFIANADDLGAYGNAANTVVQIQCSAGHNDFCLHERHFVDMRVSNRHAHDQDESAQ